MTHYFKELKHLMVLVLPIMLTQIAQSSMGFVDTLVAGRYSADALAAVALGASFWIPLFLTCTGVMMAATPMVAHEVGAQQKDKIPSIVQAGLWIAMALGVLAFFFLRNVGPILHWMNVPEQLANDTQAYLSAISWGLPAVMSYQLFRAYFEGLGQTRPGLIVALGAAVLNVPLNVIFVFGYFGAPEMGGAGCGVASAVCMWVSVIATALMQRYSPRLALGTSILTRPDWSQIGQLLKLGLPIGIAIFVETSMFSVIAILLAPSGTVVVAAHQITLTFTSQVFMIPLSFALASTIRIGTFLGAKESAAAWLTAKTVLITSGLVAIVTSTLVWFFAKEIALVFTDNLAVIELAISLLMIAALFEISDALQVTTAGALRGYKDTRVPLYLVCFAYWGIGLPLGYLLALTDTLLPAMGAAGFWYGLLIALSVAAVLLIIRLFRINKRYYVPSAAAMGA
jgi:MATE family multidrug resistance protein